MSLTEFICRTLMRMTSFPVAAPILTASRRRQKAEADDALVPGRAPDGAEPVARAARDVGPDGLALEGPTSAITTGL
jgi:hypothetical protein